MKMFNFFENYTSKLNRLVEFQTMTQILIRICYFLFKLILLRKLKMEILKLYHFNVNFMHSIWIKIKF